MKNKITTLARNWTQILISELNVHSPSDVFYFTETFQDRFLLPSSSML